MRRSHFRSVLTLIGTVAAFCVSVPRAGADPILHHVHGLAFAPDGKALLVPAHTGLALYRDGRWSLAPGPAHDFMGFSVAKRAIYTRDEGRTWKRSELDGIISPITGIAAHPSDPRTVAVSTFGGLFLSRDFGKQFRRLTPEKAVTAVVFELDEKHSLFASEGESALARMALDGGSNLRLPLPALASDLVTYIAQNPVDRKELAIATRRKNVFLSRDAGKTWKQIAREGEGL